MRLYNQAKNLIGCAKNVDKKLRALKQVLKTDLGRDFKSETMKKIQVEIKTILDICYPVKYDEEVLDVFEIQSSLKYLADLYKTLNGIKGNYPIVDKIKKIIDEDN